MSNLSNIPGGSGLPDRFRNVGDQIQQYFDLAETDPDRAVPFFVDILETQGSLTTRALALQGLGEAAKHYHVKQALADWEVLKDIAKEVKGKGEVSSDLTRWAAAKALEDIGYSLSDLQHLEGGGFTESLDRIRREIRDRKLAEINRIQRLNTRRETTAEYERNLEFWVYGPVEELFAGNDNSPNYQELVKDVISELQGRGVYLGLRSSNLLVQAEALLQARPIFKESAEIENFLYPFLEHFLYNPNQEISFRINAAEIIHTARDLNRKLKTLSKLLLEEKNPKLQEVVLRQAQSLFKQSAEIEEYLYGLLEEFLHNPNREISLRINAAEIINTATDLSKRLKTLSKLLLEDTELRNTAVRLFNPDKQELARVESDAHMVLEMLNFEYRLDKAEPKDLIISQVEQIITSSSQAIDVILARFGTSIEAGENLARRYNKSSNLLVKFLKSKQDGYLYDIRNWIQTLRSQVSELLAEHKKIAENQSLLKHIFSDIYRLDPKLYKKINEIPDLAALDRQDYKSYSYHRCQFLINMLTKIKEAIEVYINIWRLEIETETFLRKCINGIILSIVLIGGTPLLLFILSSIAGNPIWDLIIPASIALVLLVIPLYYFYYLKYIKPNKFEKSLQQLSNWQP